MDHAFMNNMNVYLLQHTLRSLCASSSSNENLNEKKMMMMKKKMKKKKKKNHHRNGNIIKKNKDGDMKHASSSSSSSSSSWVYSVFWRILPRNYPPPKWDEAASGPVAFNERTKCNKRNWILVWEDGYCDFVACSNSRSRRREAGDDDDDDDDGDGYGDGEGDDSDGDDSDDSDGGDGHGDGDGDGHGDCESLQPELFFKMSHDVYSYGEGVMGKVASENGHKWIFNRLQDDDYQLRKNTQAASILAGGGSPWQASMEAYPRTWEAQFKAGIQTIAIIAVGEGGLLQLGSTQKVEEDVEYVVRVQRRFHYLMQRSVLAGAGAGAGAAGGLFLYGHSLRPPTPLYPPYGRHSQEQQKKEQKKKKKEEDEEDDDDEEEECGMKKKKTKKKRRMGGGGGGGGGVIRPAIPPPLPPISSSLQALLSKLPPVRPPPPPRPLRFTPAGQLI